MPEKTVLTRTYKMDNEWIMNHRRKGTSADAIGDLIRFYERSKKLLKEADLK